MNLLKTQSRKHQKGFTIIEVLGVLLLLGVIAIGVVSVMPNSNVSVATEAEQLRSHLRFAQIRAQADTYQWRLVFTSTQTYQVGPVVVPGPGFTPRTVPGTGTNQRTMTDGVATTAGTVVRFDSWGRPLSDAGALLGADLTITLTRGTETQTITIEAGTGLIP